MRPQIKKIKVNSAFYKCAPVTLLMLLFLSTVSAQTKKEFWNADLMLIAKPSSQVGAIEFKNDVILNAATIFVEHKTAFGLTLNDDMQLEKTKTDEIGFTHYRFQQYYKGIKVQGCEYTVHADAAGSVISALGKLAQIVNESTSILVSENTLLRNTVNKLNCGALISDDADRMQKEFIKDAENAEALIPKGELVFAKRPVNEITKDQEYHLCYKYDLYFEKDIYDATVFVDAITGEIIKQLPLSIACVATTASTSYNGNRGINTVTYNGGYRTVDDCSSNDIYVYNMNAQADMNNAIQYFSTDNTWTTPLQQSAAQCLWGVRSTYNYYKNTHSWKGFKNNNYYIDIYNNALIELPGGGTTGRNSKWNKKGTKEYIRFGAGSDHANPGDEWGTLDGCGHEFTHAVTWHNSGLEYADESGALNESFSDIFGEIVQCYATGNSNPDYMVLGDIGAIRDMTTPRSYNDSNWYSGSNDNGGVHTNSSVGNHWFYLLCEGGSGYNTLGEYFDVNGIGWQKARDICWQMQSNYMWSTTNYNSARNCAIQAAKALYGDCSAEAIAVGNAWFAVGVGYANANDIEYVTGTFNSPNYQDRKGLRIITNIFNTNLTVESTAADFRLHAGQQIILNDGFTAKAGCDFTAYLEPCDYTIYRIAAVVAEEETEENSFKINTEKNMEAAFSLYPNPSSENTKVVFDLKTESNVSLNLYDYSGKELMQITHTKYAAGRHTIAVDVSKLQSGIYLFRMTTEGKSEIKKFTKIT
jgi:Zn-dependent metalloprotease